MEEQKEELQLVYDDQCPVCRNYCTGLQKETKNNGLTLIDARKSSPVMDEITTRKLDMDEGMVLKVNGQLFYGAEAIHELSKRKKTSGFYGWINRLFFSSSILAAFFYPLSKACRNVILRLKGIKKIRNLSKRAEG